MKRGGHFGRWLAVGLSFGCAAMLLYLAIPRAVAEFIALPGNRAAHRIETDGQIGPEAAEALIATRQRYLHWADSPQARAQLGFAERSLAYRQPTPDRRALQRAAESFELALARSPADPTTWFNLATLRYALQGASAPTVKAFSMALLTGPIMIRQTAARLALAFRLWPLLSAEDRRLVMQVIYAGWYYAHDDIVALATTPLRAGIIRATFVSDPTALAMFESLYARRQEAGRQ